MFGTAQIRELIPACSHQHLDWQLKGIMPRIDFLKTPLGRVDLGRGRLSPTAVCLTQLVSMGNIDKDDRYWQGEIEIPVEITSYHSLAAMSAGKHLYTLK